MSFAINYIYFVQVEYGDSPIKLGITSNVRSRIKSLQCGCTWNLKLLGTKIAQFPDETKLHKMLSKYSIQLEWYKSEPIVMRTIERILQDDFNWSELDNIEIADKVNIWI